jgi:hypothetical protein
MSGKYYGIIPCTAKTKALVYFVTKNFSTFSAFSHSKKTDRALDVLAAVVNYVICFIFVLGLIFYVHACHHRDALPASELAGCPISRGE